MSVELSSMMKNVGVQHTVGELVEYGYISKAGTSVVAEAGKINRLALSGATTVQLPCYEDRVAECILRFNEGSTKYNITLTLPSGYSVTRYYIQGDTLAANGAYEMMCVVIPTDVLGSFEVVSSTRKLATSES